MGHGSSKSTHQQDSSSSRVARFWRKIHHSSHRHVSSSHNKRLAAEDFAGIALLTLHGAEMKFKDKWLACVSVGEQTFRTETSDQTDKPVWNSTNRLSKSNLVGHCEIDLFEFLTQDSESDSEVLDLFDPSSSGIAVGKITVSCSVEDPTETERSFVRRILSIVDYNEDGKLSSSEFSELIKAFGNQVAAEKVQTQERDGVVSMDELTVLLAIQQEKEPLISCCPVCGEVLDSDKLNNMIHMNLCFDEGTGNQVMTGGFLTDKQASYGWMFKLSEWAHFSSYDIGLNSGSSASHILVFDRRTKRVVEELIDGKIVLSMRAIYQSKLGLGLMDAGAKELLQRISEKQGKQMNSVESAKDIPKFLKFFEDQIKLDEVKYPLEHFKLKPGARPIACMERDDVAVCAADSRLTAFKSVEDSLRFWIKGRKFSIQGLLGKEICSSSFIDGTLVIFRLAPQDYHRFHFPVSGTIERLLTYLDAYIQYVNPIAVNSKYCNVFTENKQNFQYNLDAGGICCNRATMVGSITFTKKKFGYFSFGGSTVICVFEKDAIEIDEDLLENIGMKLGVSTKERAGPELPNLENCVIGA
ncbi:hypothetical protein AAG906_037532 [Vitis piasezkii]